MDEMTRETSQSAALSDRSTCLRFLAYLIDRFGLPPDVFNAWILDDAGGRYLHACAFERLPIGLPPLVQAGMPIAQLNKKWPKLKTGAAMLLAPEATAHVIELLKDQVVAYARRETFPVDRSQIPGRSIPGYVLVKNDDLYLGLGILRGTPDGWRLESVLPKHWVHALPEQVAP
jgi:NOL1/NOP2/fmu family ribosome biogenesis protein